MKKFIMRVPMLTAHCALTLLVGMKVAQAENLEHLQRLLSQRECRSCELSRVSLVHASLNGMDLGGANLNGANLSRADLSGVNLSGANLQGASLVGANLSSANLQGADLRGADLREAVLIDADLTGANLDNAYIKNVVGLPVTTLDVKKAEDFHNWGVSEANQGNHREALDYYNQALTINPDYAPTYLGRSVSRYSLGNINPAIQDAQIASILFREQGNDRGEKISLNLVQAYGHEQAEIAKVRSRRPGFLSKVGNTFRSAATLAVQFLLRR